MNQSIGFIGAGNLAEAIIGGLRKTDKDRLIRVTNRSNNERIQRLVDTYHILAPKMQELVDASGILVIAVKPKDVVDVLTNLKNYDLNNKLIISVAAGIPMKVFSKHLPGAAVVRAMPNTSTAVLLSMTGLVRGEYVVEEQAAAAEGVFSAIGQTLWIPEEKMNALIGISGSGPAYFYLLTENLIQAGVKLGLSEAEADRLARVTLVGAGKMLMEIGKTPGRLREEVTSPNGTTYAAMSVFKEEKFPEIVVKAVQACAQRAEDMEREYSK